MALSPLTTQATSCPAVESFHDEVARTSGSFLGTAGDVEPRTDPHYLAWPFTVHVPLRGLPSDPTRVELPNSGGSCSAAFDPGCTYLVAGEPGPNGGLRIDVGRGRGGFTQVHC